MIPKTKFVIFSLSNTSGMGRFVQEFAEGIASRQSDTVLVAPKLLRTPKVGKYILLKGEPRLSQRRLVRAIRLLWVNAQAAWEVANVADKTTIFTMVSIHASLPFSLLPLAAAKARGAIAVLNLHDIYSHAPRYPQGMQWLEKWLYRVAYRSFHILAVMTQRQVERLSSEVGVPPGRITVVHHGPFPVSAVARPATNSPLKLLIFGSLRRNKNIIESLQAVRQLAGNGVKVDLKIAGAPRWEERAYWAQCLEEIDRAENVELCAEFIADPALPAVLSGVDALLCPYSEFDSRSGVEVLALSNGIPVIATRSAVSGDYPERDPSSVEITDPVTADSIASAILKFSKTPREDRLAAAQYRAKQFASQLLWEQNYSIIVTAVQRMLSNPTE